MTEKEIADVLKENVKRRNAYFRKYDPVVGDDKQEVIRRKSLIIDGTLFNVPVAMLDEPFVKAYKKHRCDADALLKEAGLEPTRANRTEVYDTLMAIRLKHDFEFWAATCAKITDKTTKAYIPLILNRGQRRLIAAYEKRRLQGKPVRIVLVKARQWGGSTATDAYMTWMIAYHYENWHTCIVALDQTQATNIRSMMKTIITELPPYHPSLSFKRFENLETIRLIPERGARIQIGSAEKPDALRSFDFSMVHLSEVGLWRDTKTKSGEDLAQTIYSTVPESAGTMIVFESTAKGVGNFFYNQYIAAKKNVKEGADGYEPVFVSWFDIEKYTTTVYSVRREVEKFTDYNWWQWRQGATIEGIVWYNRTKRANNWNDFQMKSEYPTTADEAFQTTSNKYFNDEMLESIHANCKTPVFIGDIRGNALTGEGALDNIELIPNDSLHHEVLKIWIQPGDGLNVGEVAKNRFVVTVDVGGRSDRADQSVITVLDRLSLSGEFGAVERAAIWYGHIDPDLLAYKAAQIAKYYDNALLVIESNTYDTRYKKGKKGETKEGDHSFTVLDTLGEVYDNLYRRRTGPDSVSDHALRKIGWHMNKQTKYLAYDDYYVRIRNHEYMEYSEDAYEEAAALTTNTDGIIEAMPGCRDDMQDTTAVGVYIAYNSMDKVKIVSAYDKKKTTRTTTGAGVSTF